MSDYYGKLVESDGQQDTGLPTWGTLLTQKVTSARSVCKRQGKDAVHPMTGQADVEYLETAVAKATQISTRTSE